MKRFRETLIILIAMVLVTDTFDASLLRGQGASRKLRFATATVKRKEGGLPFAKFTLEDRRFTARAAPLPALIRYAYETSRPATEGKVPVQPFFDIDATSTAAATPSQMREMLRNLLAEHFALRTHVQPREMAVFRLLIGPGGHKLRPVTGQGVADPSGAKLPAGQFAVYSNDGWHFAAASVTVREIAQRFSDDFDIAKPVIDATGVRGTFDVNVVHAVAEGESVSAVVAKELGLKLEPATASVNVLVIDGFNLP